MPLCKDRPVIRDNVMRYFHHEVRCPVAARNAYYRFSHVWTILTAFGDDRITGAADRYRAETVAKSFWRNSGIDGVQVALAL